ncbi:MAG TPA: hypothetical protein VKN18_02845 [Blastocatellia bacterium]|nr:hypothetical protein [Blastocatellia bacterium]
MNIARKFRTRSFVILSVLLIGFFTSVEGTHSDLALMQSKRPQEPSTRILRAEDFADPRLERGSGLEPVEFVVEINPRLTPYLFRLIPSSDSRWSEKPRFVGKFEISRIGDKHLLQTIDLIAVADVSDFTRTFCAEDFNFDGYLDFKVLSDHGAKWGSYQYWVFDPTSGKFITSELTEQLGEIKANTYVWNAESRTLQVGFLNLDQARIGETYRIEDTGLTLIGIEDRLKDCEGNFRKVKYKIIDGKRDGKDTLPLEPCQRIWEDIVDGESHNYEMRLEAGQHLRVEVYGDLDLVLALSGPDGKLLLVVEDLNESDEHGISWTPEVTGTYRLEVRPLKKKPVAGRYDISMQQLRPIAR